MKKRIIALFLCFVMLFSSLDFSMVSASDEEKTEVNILCDDVMVNTLSISEDEKKELSAEVIGGKSNGHYQWQILANVTEDIWVNIYDANEKTLAVSSALIDEVMDINGSAYVRCQVEIDGTSYYSDAINVCVLPCMDQVMMKAVKPADDSALVSTEGKATITIQYLDSMTGDAIYSPYTAQIEVGTNYIQSVTSPTFLGYAPYWNSANPDIEIPDEGEVSAEEPANIILLNYQNVQEDIVVRVYYKPVPVPFGIKYFFQNINNDLYTENASLYYTSTAETGTIITDEELISHAGDTTGFTKLYHFPETVAADGSTVFECYYDRNYYLLKFDMNGGYGVDPVYARYDTSFLVNKPEKPGYVFLGWDLISETIDGVVYDETTHGTKYGNGIANELPSKIPAASQSYRAIWGEQETVYSTVYWIQNADNNDYSYAGSAKHEAISGTKVSGEDKIETEVYRCDMSEHTHDSECYHCGDPSHTHTDSCYGCGMAKHVHTITCFTEEDVTIISDTPFTREVGSDLKNGYIYRHRYKQVDNYFYLNNTWYFIGNDDDFSGIVAKDEIEGPTEYWTYNKGPAASLCNNSQHEHSVNCSLCKENEHKHTTDCEFDASRYVFEKADEEVLVKGDGSTVVNVYYKRKEYSLRFYYARSSVNTGGNSVYEVVGGSTYRFGTYGGADENTSVKDLLGKVGDWGQVQELPAIFEEYKNDPRVSLGSTNFDDTSAYTYHYITFTARYGAYIGDLWPIGMFEAAKVAEKHNTYHDPQNEYEYCKYENAYFSAWNGEYKVKYTQDNASSRDGNETIKGCYLYLDDTILFDSKFQDGSVVSYLGFWENGDDIGWSIPELYEYKLYLKNVDDTAYEVDRVFNTYDDSNVGSQTATSIEGFTHTHRDSREWSADEIAAANLKVASAFTVNFYYDRLKYDLAFYNYNGIVKETEKPYEASLSEEYFVPDYPLDLEEDAYEFAGWYTTAGCYDGTEFDFETGKMPASDLIVYAKWVPKVHTVRFFQTYNDMLASTNPIKTVEVPHGNVVSSVEEPEDQTGEGYVFTGWFYISAGEKVAYTPLDMPVRRSMNVFAGWSSHKSQPYTVNYALDKKETDQAWIARLEEAAQNEYVDNERYEVTDGNTVRSYVYLEKDNGWHLCIANETSGYAYQGTTRTFNAKAGDPYNQLYAQYNVGYYPLQASHSITIQDGKNVFTFTYVYADEIKYTIQFRDKNTNVQLAETEVYQTKNAVVTERFKVITDYIPDAFYKRLIIAVKEDENGNIVGSEENVIVFYYTKNETSAYYAVHYMMEKADADYSDGMNYAIDGTGDFEENDAYTEGIGTIGSECRIVPSEFTGYSYVSDKATVVTNAGNTKSDIGISDAEPPYFSINVESSGTELYIFYTRKEYTYNVYHLEYGTDISDLSSLVYNPAEDNGVLSPIEESKGKFGTIATAYAKTFEEMNCVSKNVQTIEIQANEVQNNLIFYYMPLQYTVEYRIVDEVGGTLSTTIEVLDSKKDCEGSVPTADEKYRFVGWFWDEECKIPVVSNEKVEVDAQGKLTPETTEMNPMPSVNIFYAKFELLKGSITITRKNAEDQVFIYEVTNKNDASQVVYVTVSGEASTTVHGLPYGEYEVKQLNDWSWRYGDSSIDVTLESESEAVTFGKQSLADKIWWLNDNSILVRNKYTEGGAR